MKRLLLYSLSSLLFIISSFANTPNADNVRDVKKSRPLRSVANRVANDDANVTAAFYINNSAQNLAGNFFSFTDGSTTAPGITITGYTWDFGEGSAVSNLQNPTHTYAASGTYTVSLYVTATDGTNTFSGDIAASVTVYAQPDANGIVYVNKNAAGGMRIGNSWTNAIKEVADALLAAKNNTAIKQIWVAAGTYYPQTTLGGSPDNRAKSFLLPKNVKVYGSFAGNETDTSQRNVNANLSTLSGDLGIANDYSDNSYHVVTTVGDAGTATLNGFIVSGGNANGSNNVTVNGEIVYFNYGGGIYMMKSNLLINNVSFVSNTAQYGGAAMIFVDMGATFKDVGFFSNTAAQGGATYINSAGTPTFERVAFLGNSATAVGGAIRIGNNCNPIFKSVQFTGNKATTYGSAIYNASNLTISITNGTFSANNDAWGTIYSLTGSKVSLQNSIVYGNRAGIYNTDGSSNPIQYSLVQGLGTDAANNNLDGNVNPLFAAPGSYNSAPTTGGNYTLQSASPGINAGSNALYDALDVASLDVGGLPRVHNYASGGKIDMGANEYQGLDAQSITAANTTKNYGDVAFVPTASASSGLALTFQSSDNNTIEPFIDAADGNKLKLKIKKAGTATITASQAGNSDYAAATDVQFTVTVNKAALTVTAKDTTKTYDGLVFTGGNGVSYSGFVNGDDSTAALTGTLGYSGTAQSAKNVNTYTITPGGLSASNYSISYVNGTLTISKAALTVTAKDSSKVYDGLVFNGGNGVTYTGFVNNETSAALSGTLAYSGTSQGASNVNNYVITPSGLTSNNYNISYANGSLTISKAALIITAKDSSKVYDGLAFNGGSGVTYTGFVNNEDSTQALNGAITYSGSSQGAKSKGAYVIQPGGLSAQNYTISYQAGALNINKASLTITAKDSTKTYNGTAFAGGNGVTYSGFVNNEDSTQALTGSLVYSGTSQGAKNVNNYTIVPGGLSANNYAITYQNGNLNIGKAALTVTAKDSSKTYDGLTFSKGNGVTYSGFVNNEDSTQALTGTLTYSGTSQGAKDVNNYIIVPGGLSANNYSLSYANGALTISKAALTITAKDSSKIYDGSTFSNGNGVTYTGFVNNEDSTQALTGTLAYSGTSQGAKNVNSYTIIPSGLLANNYSLSYVNGTLIISKAALTITAKDSSKVYDGIAFNGGNGIAYAGFVNNETSTNLTGTLIYSGTSQGATSVNNYVIAPGGLTSGNYNISYVNGKLTISKAVLTIAANDSSKTYDGLAFSGGNGVTYSGFVNNQTSADLAGTLAYTGTSQGATNVNNYAIVPGGLTSNNYDINYVNGNLTISKAALTITAKDSSKVYDAVAFNGGNGVTYTGFVNNENNAVLTGTLSYSGTSQNAVNTGNYVITLSGLTSGNYDIQYANGSLTITKAALKITAEDKTKVYGDADPALTYVATGWATGDGNSLITGTLQRLAGENVGNFTINQNTLSAGNNYNITYAAGNFAITPASLTITADPQTKVYGTADPALTFVATGWKNGDAGNNGTLTREAGENVGTYAIQQGTIGTGANYTIAFIGNNLTITKAPQLITWAQDLTIGCTADITQVQLNATTNSGLTISYAISSTDVGTITGNMLTPVLPGYAVITASQAGDANHFAAESVENNVTYRSASAIRQHWSDVLMFDNSSNNYTKWEWYKNNSLVSGQTSAYYSEPTTLSGTYYVIATDKNGEAIQSCPLTLNGSATVTAGIKVYPNPVTAGSTATVTCNYTDAALQGAKMAIVDMSGKIQQEITNVKGTQTITAPSARGMYYITLLLKNGQKASVNLLVK